MRTLSMVSQSWLHSSTVSIQGIMLFFSFLWNFLLKKSDRKKQSEIHHKKMLVNQQDGELQTIPNTNRQKAV